MRLNTKSVVMVAVIIIAIVGCSSSNNGSNIGSASGVKGDDTTTLRVGDCAVLWGIPNDTNPNGNPQGYLRKVGCAGSPRPQEYMVLSIHDGRNFTCPGQGGP